MNWAIVAMVFWAPIAMLTARGVRRWKLKQRWLILLACWLWPVTWVIAIALFPIVPHDDGD